MFAAESQRLPLEEFEDVKNQMETFALRFNSLILERKSAVLNSRQHHTNKVNELERNIARLRKEIEASTARKSKTESAIGETLADLTSKQAKVDEMNTQLLKLTYAKLELETHIGELKAQVARREAQLAYSQQNLHDQLAKDRGELTKFEMYLGLRIEAVEADLLRFKFINIDAGDIDKEVWCELFISEEKYQIVTTSPSLPTEKVRQIENDFNRHGEFIVFLKTMRTALRDTA